METIRISPELAAVRRRRAELRETLDALEEALAAPSPDRETKWGENVRGVLVEVADDFAAHIAVTEGSDGLHSEIRTSAPRLANAVQVLTDEHAQIVAEIAELMRLCRPPMTADQVARIRDLGTHLLGQIVRHRQRGADLVYEAYEFDLGGVD